MRLALGLQNYTSGKGKVELKDSSMRPIEIFMCSVVSNAVARVVNSISWDAGDASAHGHDRFPFYTASALVLLLHSLVSWIFLACVGSQDGLW